MIEIKNLDQVIKQVDEWEAQVNQLVTDAAKGLSIALFKYAVQISPQYSGDFAANWKLNLNTVDTSAELGLFRVLGSDNRPFRSEGHKEAVQYALNANRGRAAPFKLGDSVFISNSSDHGEDNYTFRIWDNTIKFRPVNRGQIQRRLDDFMARYAVIDYATARRLAKETLT